MDRAANLTRESKNWMSALVNAYMEPPKNTFKITSKGDVVLVDVGIFARITGKEAPLKRDFMESVQEIILKITEIKGGIPYVEQLCANAFKTLIETNDRNLVIRKLYLAHLTDEQPGMSGRQGQGKTRVEVREEVEHRTKPGVTVFSRINPFKKLSNDVADILNSADVVMFGEQ